MKRGAGGAVRPAVAVRVAAAPAWARAHVTDLMVTAALGTVTVVLYLVASARLLPHSGDLALFGADSARVLRHMSVRGPMLDRSQFHPLFPLLAQTPTRLGLALGLGRLDAARVVMAGWGAVAVMAIYGLGRRLGLAPVAAAGPAALAAGSGAFLFFFTIPETYGVGAAVGAVVLVVVAGWTRRPRPVAAGACLVAGGAAVVTGALVPLVAVGWAERSWRRRAAILLGAAAGATLLAATQLLLYGTRLQPTLRGESQFLRTDRWAAVADSVRTLLADAWLTPSPRFASARVTFLGVGTFSGGPVRVVGLVLLAGLWLAVARGAWLSRGHVLVPAVLAGLAFHVAFYAVYGDEAFLYAAGLVPLVSALVVVAAAQPKVGRLVATLTWAVAPLAAWVNLAHLASAGRLL